LFHPGATETTSLKSTKLLQSRWQQAKDKRQMGDEGKQKAEISV